MEVVWFRLSLHLRRSLQDFRRDEETGCGSLNGISDKKGCSLNSGVGQAPLGLQQHLSFFFVGVEEANTSYGNHL